MKKIIIVLVFLSLFILQGSAEILTLQQCIENALENDSSIIQEKLRIEALELKIKQIKTNFLPDATLSQGISYSDTSGKESYSTRLGVNYTINDGGLRNNELDIAKLNVEREKQEYNRLKNNIIFNISELYYRIQQKKQGIDLQNTILERRKKDLILIRLKYHAGKESLQAVNESETSFKEAEYRKLKEERELGNIYFEINTAMGKDLNYKFDVFEEKISFTPFNSDDILNLSIENRPEIQKLLISENINLLNKKNIYANYKPKLSASMSESLGGKEIFKNDSFSASLSLSYKLYDGGKKNILLEESANSVKATENEIKKLKDDIVIEVFNALKNYELAYAKYQIDELILKAKKDIYLLTKLKYEQGSETYFVFQNKENDLSQAEYNHVSSLYNFRTSLLTLQKVAGGKL
ncbi:MAG: TolC family protein [Candidatus Muirbacterium halophilum]|nr:TolC family protein [Candidatus Muirbacterium halophilum]MCK9476671.1 TolC family protein [Candidatus Muirbacterium halophilum]